METGSFLQLLRDDVLAAAPAMLGMHLVRGDRRARIVEVEAYRAEDDPACHAFNKTRMKNMVMFGPPGFAYVYFNYGVHWMLNVVAHDHGMAAAILIRAAEPLEGLERMRANRPKARKDEDLLSGPGKLAAAFEITSADNGADLLQQRGQAVGPPGLPPLLIEPAEQAARIVTGPRIGIAVGKAHDYPWRFMDADRLRWVSARVPTL